MKKYHILAMAAAIGIAGSAAAPVHAAESGFAGLRQASKNCLVTVGQIGSQDEWENILKELCGKFGVIEWTGCLPPEFPGIDFPEIEKPGDGEETPNPEPENPGNGGETPGPEPENPGNGGETSGPEPENPGNGGETPGPEPENPGNGGETPRPEPENPGNGGETPGPEPENPGNGEESPEPDQEENSFAIQIAELVNAERAKAGIGALTLDQGITSAAQIRAQEIEVSFSHTRPDGRRFSSVLTDAGITFRNSGENIAWGQRSPQEVMNGWMNSEGHRANILNPNFTKIGIGHYQNAAGRNYWSQLFTS